MKESQRSRNGGTSAPNFNRIMLRNKIRNKLTFVDFGTKPGLLQNHFFKENVRCYYQQQYKRSKNFLAELTRGLLQYLHTICGPALRILGI